MSNDKRKEADVEVEVKATTARPAVKEQGEKNIDVDVRKVSDDAQTRSM